MAAVLVTRERALTVGSLALGHLAARGFLAAFRQLGRVVKIRA